MSPATSFCGKCGKPLAVSDDRFCRACGAPIAVVAASVPATDSVTGVTVKLPAALPRPQRCENCGATRTTVNRTHCARCRKYQWPEPQADEYVSGYRQVRSPTGELAFVRRGRAVRKLLLIFGGGFVVLLVIVAAVSGSGDSADKTSPASSTNHPPASQFVPSSPPDLPITLVGKLTCDNLDSTGPRKCTGTVRNNTAYTINAPILAIQWKGSEEVEAGTIDINPLLSGQESSFSVVTPRANPALKDYIIVAD